MTDLVSRDPNGVRVIYIEKDGLVFGTTLLGRLLPTHGRVLGFILPRYVFLVDGAVGLSEFLSKIHAPSGFEYADRGQINWVVHETEFGEGTSMLGIVNAAGGISYKYPTRIVGLMCNTQLGQPPLAVVAGEHHGLPEVMGFLQAMTMKV